MGEVIPDVQGKIIMDSVTVVALPNLYLITHLIRFLPFSIFGLVSP